MDYLKELIGAISNLKYDAVGVHADQAEQLLELIKSQDIQSDQEAMDLLYPDDRNAPKYYSKAKVRLNDRLLNTFLIAPTEKTDIQKAHSKCYREHAIFEKLIAVGLWPQARKLGEKLVKQSVKYHFTSITYLVARKLKRHHATITGERSKYLYYTEIVSTYRELMEAEELAEDYYSDLASNFSRTKKPRRDLSKIADQYIQDLNKLAPASQSYFFNLFFYTISIIKEELDCNYAAVAMVSKKAIQYFESLPFQAPYSSLLTFHYKAGLALLQLDEFAAAQEHIGKGLSLCPVGSYNWLEISRIKIKACFHQKDYASAYQAVKAASKYVEGLQAEQFKLFEAYCHYFAELGLLEINAKKYRIHKLLNELLISSQDKKGNNISIQLLQILFYMARGEYSKVIGRLDALKIYSKRYLKKTLRSKYFLELLLLFADCNFEVDPFLECSHELRQQLASTPLSVQDSDIELVPYEDLLEGVLGRVLV